jgi:hypothetical protein
MSAVMVAAGGAAATRSAAGETRAYHFFGFWRKPGYFFCFFLSRVFLSCVLCIVVPAVLLSAEQKRTRARHG